MDDVIREKLEQFKRSAIKSVVSLIKENRSNFTIGKGYISGNSIDVWQIKEGEDVGSFTYYDNKEDRDHDYNLLLELVGEDTE